MQVPSPHLDLLTLNLNFKKILGDSCLSKVPLTQDYLESLRRGQVCQLNRKGLEDRKDWSTQRLLSLGLASILPGIIKLII